MHLLSYLLVGTRQSLSGGAGLNWGLSVMFTRSSAASSNQLPSIEKMFEWLPTKILKFQKKFAKDVNFIC